MGADLIIDAAAFKREPNKELWNRMRTKYHKLLEESGIDYEAFESETGNQIDAEQARKIIDDFFDILEYGARDVTDIKVGEYIIYITGGMSWGDAPSECFDTFVDFHRLFPYEFIDDVLEE